jgi:hypothetical protein
VSLHHKDDSDGAGPMGLFLAHSEYGCYIEDQFPGHHFSDDFLSEVYRRTIGHVGAIEDFLRVMKTIRYIASKSSINTLGNHPQLRHHLLTEFDFCWETF